MASIAVYDDKANSISVDLDNLLDKLRKNKEVKELITLNPFQVAVEIPLDTHLPDPEKAFQPIESAVDGLRDEAEKEVWELVAKLQKLQAEEAGGNKSAVDTAEKVVKASEKRLKELAGRVGLTLRKAVQKIVNKEAEEKVQLRSTSRTNFKGIELWEEAFENKSEAVTVTPHFETLAKALAAAGKEALKQSQAEKIAREDVQEALKKKKKDIQDYLKKVENKAEAANFNLQKFAKEHLKDVREVEAVKDKYEELLTAFEKKLQETDKEVDKLMRMIDKDKVLKEDKQVLKAVEDYAAALNRIAGTFAGKHTALGPASEVFEEPWENGAAFDKAASVLEKEKGTTVSGKEMQDAGEDLEKFSKKMK